jgi:hypothetical protein
MACYAIVEAVSFGPERDNRFAIRISLLPLSALSEAFRSRAVSLTRPMPST